MSANGFYVKVELAKDSGKSFEKNWNGKEFKKFMKSVHIHVPHLLEVIHELKVPTALPPPPRLAPLLTLVFAGASAVARGGN